MEKVVKNLTSLGRKHLTLFVLISFFVALAVYFEAKKYLSKEKTTLSTPRVLVTKRSLNKGESIAFFDLGIKPLSPLPEGVLTDQDLFLLKDARLKENLPKNSLVRFDDLNLPPVLLGISKQIPQGMRAYLLKENHHSHIRIGDRVDLYVISLNEKRESKLLVENVEVMDVKRYSKGSDITLAIFPQDILELETESHHSRILALLRNPKDKSFSQRHALSKKRGSFLRKVEFIKENEDD